MRLPRMRLTVRVMMAAVAIAGLSLGIGSAMQRRVALFRQKAAQEAFLLGSQRRPLPERKVPHHEALRRKYERAAGYPWLPVEPDPPEPE
jgi:hypothetical protein